MVSLTLTAYFARVSTWIQQIDISKVDNFTEHGFKSLSKERSCAQIDLQCSLSVCQHDYTNSTKTNIIKLCEKVQKRKTPDILPH